MKNTPQLEILVGTSASGKSTYSKEQWEKDPKNTVLVSRDNIRQLLFGFTDSNVQEYYSRKDLRGRENNVTDNLEEIIRFNLGKGKKVIVDNTHLKLSFINSYQKFNVPTTLVVFNTDLNVCVERDNNRVKAVGEAVIKKQSRQFKTLIDSIDLNFPKNEITTVPLFTFGYDRYKYTPNPDLASCVVVDIDGTIAEKGDRSPYDMNKVDEDTEKTNITAVVRALKEMNYPIIICTGRDGSGREKSIQWLLDNDIPFDRFYIREEGDMRPDFVVKEEMWMEIVKDFNILTMIDDRRQVIDHARSLNFTVMDVANHTF